MIKNKIFAAAAAVVLSLGFCACEDDEMNTNPNVGLPVALSSVSIAEGAEIEPSVTEITFVYDRPVAVNPTRPITLNGTALSTSVVEESTVVATVSLKVGTNYTLEIPANGVAGVNTATFAPALTLHFTTSGKVVFEPLALVNPNATQQVKNVYNFLVEQNGKKIISGAMANVNNNNDFPGWVKSVTGKDVALIGYDFIHLPESGQNWIDYSDISPAKEQWKNNGLVSYMWHWRAPSDKDAYDSKNYNRYGTRVPGANVEDATEFDIREAVIEGTWQNEFILADIDKVAGYLKILQEAGIPVIWRPLHEAAGSYRYNGAWFWWGRYGDEPTKALWKLMYDRLVNHHGLNNLIWVWTAQYEAGFEEQMVASYPGNEYCDIVGVDLYASNDNSQLDAYNALSQMTGGKRLCTISETGLVQNPDKCIADGANWSWFNIWYSYNQHLNGNTPDNFGNTPESLKAVMESPYTITRDQMPSLK